MTRRRSTITEQGMPVELSVEGDPQLWLSEHLGQVGELLEAGGAVLLHSQQDTAPTLLEVYRVATGYAPMGYADQHTPRTKLSETTYTSTEYPSSQSIPFHSENSKNREWPGIIAFYCDTPAASGGATPIADNAAVLARLSSSLVDRFVAEGVKYVRNFHEGLGVSWKKAFGLSHLDELYDYCEREGYTLEQKDEGVVTVSHTRPALLDHPRTGQPLWFNQVQLFHPAALDPSVRSDLSVFGSESSFPSYVEYGSGAPIDDATIHSISGAFSSSAVRFPWQAGDLLVLDNMKVAHARDPFTGSRKILVSMFQPQAAAI